MCRNVRDWAWNVHMQGKFSAKISQRSFWWSIRKENQIYLSNSLQKRSKIPVANHFTAIEAKRKKKIGPGKKNVIWILQRTTSLNLKSTLGKTSLCFLMYPKLSEIFEPSDREGRTDRVSNRAGNRSGKILKSNSSGRTGFWIELLVHASQK
jgi:hypothetical protein